MQMTHLNCSVVDYICLLTVLRKYSALKSLSDNEEADIPFH